VTREGERFTLYAEDEHVDYWELTDPDYAADVMMSGQFEGRLDDGTEPGGEFEVLASEWRRIKASEIVRRAGTRPSIIDLESAGEDFMAEGADYWPPKEHYVGIMRAILRGDIDAYCAEHGCQPNMAEHVCDLPPVRHRWLGDDRYEMLNDEPGRAGGGDGR